MGTDGLYVFVYNKKCYVFYKGMDSYPKGLGNLLVQEINDWTPEYIEELKQWILKINIYTDQSYCGFESIEHSVRHAAQYNCYISTLPPNFGHREGHHQWIYTIDLDNTQFSVEWNDTYPQENGEICECPRKQVFSLINIPESWIDIIDRCSD
jgi:hypothetical protein